MAKAKRTIQQSPIIGSVKRSAVRLAVRSIHVVPSADTWVVVKPGSVPQAFPSKDKAVTFARTVKLHPEGRVLIHEGNGNVVPDVDC